jgi:hypothetical protein
LKLLSIEPTPSPNAMKLNVDERVERGRTYTKDNLQSAPPLIRKLLDIPGVKSVFRTADFLSLERYPNADWKRVLEEVRAVFGENAAAGLPSHFADEGGFVEARLYVQVFRGIPMQIRVRTDGAEVRRALPDRFASAAMEAGYASPNLIRERKLEDWGVRYGEAEEIADQAVAEIEAAYGDERLRQLVEQAKKAAPGDDVLPEWRNLSDQEIAGHLDHPDWRVRYQAFGQLRPSEDNLPLIARALQDDNASMRRLAVVYLGEVGSPEALGMLIGALKDRSAAVRRTAGDTLSDLGAREAIRPMTEALEDENKLVRWRAARFLYEHGDETAIEALQKAADDEEFEVALQARMALDRITGGQEAEGAVWQQMARAREKGEEGIE